jgi:hypothetical protein
MKKAVLSLLACGTAAMILSSCGGAKYTPLTEDQKKAKADSLYTAKYADEAKAKSDACTAEMGAKVDAKVAEHMKAAEAAGGK